MDFAIFSISSQKAQVVLFLYYQLFSCATYEIFDFWKANGRQYWCVSLACKEASDL